MLTAYSAWRYHCLLVNIPYFSLQRSVLEYRVRQANKEKVQYLAGSSSKFLPILNYYCFFGCCWLISLGFLIVSVSFGLILRTAQAFLRHNSGLFIWLDSKQLQNISSELITFGPFLLDIHCSIFPHNWSWSFILYTSWFPQLLVSSFNLTILLSIFVPLVSQILFRLQHFH